MAARYGLPLPRHLLIFRCPQASLSYTLMSRPQPARCNAPEGRRRKNRGRRSRLSQRLTWHEWSNGTGKCDAGGQRVGATGKEPWRETLEKRGQACARRTRQQGSSRKADRGVLKERREGRRWTRGGMRAQESGKAANLARGEDRGRGNVSKKGKRAKGIRRGSEQRAVSTEASCELSWICAQSEESYRPV